MPYLREAWRKSLKYPVVLLLPVLGTAVARIFAASAGWAVGDGSLAGAYTVAGFVIGLLSPAVASGYAAVVGIASKGRPPSWKDFASNLSTYYWRILGAAMAVQGAFSMLFRGASWSLISTGGPSGPFPWLLLPVGLAVGAVAHVWFAAVVLDGARASEGAALALRSFSVRPRDYAILAAGWMGSALVLDLLSRVLPAASYLTAVLTAALTGYFRMAAFLTYNGAFAASLPGWDGLKPPLFRPSP